MVVSVLSPGVAGEPSHTLRVIAEAQELKPMSESGTDTSHFHFILWAQHVTKQAENQGWARLAYPCWKDVGGPWQSRSRPNIFLSGGS
jgi:hypothetical protein